MAEENHKKASQIGQQRVLNSEPPEFESSELPLRQLVWLPCFGSRNNFITIVFKICRLCAKQGNLFLHLSEAIEVSDFHFNFEFCFVQSFTVIYFNLVFVTGRFGFEFVVYFYGYFVVIGRNVRWYSKYCSGRNRVCTTYFFQTQRHLFRIQETQVSLRKFFFFPMTINKSQGQTFPFAGVEWRQDFFSQGQVYVTCSRCKVTRKPGYFTTILQNG